MNSPGDKHEISCPHCQARIELEEVVVASQKTFLQFTYPCPECAGLILVILPEGKYDMIFRAALDKSCMRLDGLFDQIRHIYYRICDSLFEGGIPPDEWQKLLAFVEMLETCLDGDERLIDPEAARDFIIDLELFGVPSDLNS